MILPKYILFISKKRVHDCLPSQLVHMLFSICSSCSVDMGGKLKGLGKHIPLKPFQCFLVDQGDRKHYFKRQSFIFHFDDDSATHCLTF